MIRRFFQNSTVKQRVSILILLFIAGFSAFGQMTSDQVSNVIAQALTRANDFIDAGLMTTGVVAVVDREGFVLGVWSATTNQPSQVDIVDAITKAGTGAFLSSDQEAFTSRTAGFIVQQHFPPSIKNTPTGPLVGVNFSSLCFSDVNYFKNPNTFDQFAFGGGGTNGTPIVSLSSNLALAPLSGLNGSPGGVPLYDDNGSNLIGGVGVTIAGRPPLPELYDIQQTSVQRPDTNEDVALAGQMGFEPAPVFLATHVLINGIRVPYVNSKTKIEPTLPLGTVGMPVPGYDITGSPPVKYPIITLGGVTGEMRAPIVDDPLGQLSASDVTNILMLSAQRAVHTRAGIRLPRGQSAQVFISVINNPATPGVAPAVLGTFRTASLTNGLTNGATIFSWDVSVQKARTALFFSSPLATNLMPAQLWNKALSSRAVGFLAQSNYPPGIQGKPPGPLLRLQEKFSLLQPGFTNVLNGVFLTSIQALTSPNPNLTNGITIFPGGFPLYRNGVLIGAIGVSGDGVDQDDIISASGTVNFLAPNAIRSDQVIFRGARLPYAKFPRNPEL